METDVSMQETVYGTGMEDSHVMSEKVQSLASSVYQEMERMIERYDEDVVKELMPLVVSILENLDSAVMDNQEHEVELELLREDNEQLMTQYEREKQLRRTSEQRLMEIEYSTEDEQREYVSKVESLESIVRLLELKTKNSTDHASRLEEKESEMRKEYSKLHERYTELFKTHMDYMERTKILFGSDRIDSLSHRPRNLHFSHGKSGAMLTNMSQENSNRNIMSPAELPSLVSLNPSSDSNTSLKSELQDMHVSSVLSPMSPLFDDSKSSAEQSSKVTMEKSQITDQIIHSDRATGTKSCWMEDDFESNVNDVVITSPEMDEVEELNSFSFDVGNKREMKRPNTLYQELSFQDADALGDVDECADVTGDYTNPGDYASSDSESDLDHEQKVADNFYGMGKEVENLISENNELLATKNALNIVKDDLIAKVDELTSEQEILREDLKSYMAVKEKLSRKISELEEELKKTKSDMEKKSNKSDDEDDVPMAQRKRFTRVEMARVLMERNQYKERLMELQEAVRWTEMIRASRSDSSLDTKRTKSSIWKFFSNLFNANEKPQRKTLPYVNVHYNAPTSNASPALETMRRKRLGDRHRSFDHHDTDIASEKLLQQRATERREQYKQVRAHVCKDNGRLQAYGWSLPTKNMTPPGKPTDSVSSSKPASLAPVPVPVFCRPLSSPEPGMKVWCAAGVDLSGGQPEDIHTNVSVGSSLFYIDTAEAGDGNSSVVNQRSGSSKPADKTESSSIVWFCTSSHIGSTIAIVDANSPEKMVDTFHTPNPDLLCVTSVPGVKDSDFVVEESFMKLGTMKRKDEDDSLSKHETGAAAPQIGKITLMTAKRDSIFSSRSSSVSDDKPSSGMRSPSIEMGQIPEECELSHVADEKSERMSSVLPTMWLGSQSGEIFVHSSIAQVWRSIHTVKLQDSVLSIVHIRGRVFCALADGSVTVFHRSENGEWDLSNYHVIDLGFPHHSIRCMTIVNENVWCGYRNCIRVLNAKTLSIVDSFYAHPRKESQVRQMSWAGDGVWITIRLDSTLRLYHASTHQHLQDVDIEPYVSKMLGTGKLGFSFVRITAMLVSCKRLWMGTGNGVIISVPLTDTSKQATMETTPKAPGGMVRVYNSDSTSTKTSSTTGYMPYCTMAHAQLSFHGHRDAVKFFVSVPGETSNSAEGASGSDSRNKSQGTKSGAENRNPNVMIIISGGEGYIDFRVGDGDDDELLAAVVNEEKKAPLITDPKNDKSHLIVWQVPLPEE